MNRDELGVVPPDVVLALWDAVFRSCVDDFRTIWSKSGRSSKGVLSGCWSHCGWPFLGRGLLRIRGRRLGGRPVGSRGSSRDPVGCKRLVKGMRLVFVVLSTSLTPLLLQSFSFVDV